MKIAITGATGYIGQRLIRAAMLAGHETLALSRHPVKLFGVEWRRFDLGDRGPLSLPRGVDAVFHLAAETRHAQGAEQIELESALRLINAAGDIGAGFVFVSSQTARADAPTAYGRIKWQIERATLAAGGWVVRPGQVYGGPERGLFGALCALVRRLPVLPAFVPEPVVQPVHVDDLAEALLNCLTLEPSSVLCVGTSEGIDFTEFLQAIAHGRTGRWPISLPVPTRMVRSVARLLGPGLNSRLGLDRLDSLFSLPQMETAGDLQRLSLTLRPLCAGMTRSGKGRRDLLVEGRAILAYVLRTPPSSTLVRRYVKAIERLRAGRALRLPGLVLRFPMLFSLVDGAWRLEAVFRKELDWRLNAGLMLAEATPQGALRFLGAYRRAGWLRSSLRMTLAVLKEANRLAGQLVLRPLLARVGRRGVFK